MNASIARTQRLLEDHPVKEIPLVKVVEHWKKEQPGATPLDGLRMRAVLAGLAFLFKGYIVLEVDRWKVNTLTGVHARRTARRFRNLMEAIYATTFEETEATD